MNLNTAIKESVNEKTQIAYALPPLLKNGLTALNKTHLAWDYIQNYRWIRKTGHADHLAYASGIYITAEFIFPSIGQKALTYLLAVKCIQDLFQQHVKVYISYKNLKAALFNTYPCRQKCQWKTEESQTFGLKASTYLWLEIRMIELKQRMLRIARHCFILIKHLFILSKRYNEAYKISKIDPHSRLQGLAEISAKYASYCTHLQENGRKLLAKLKKNEKKVDFLLNKLETKERVDTWYKEMTPKVSPSQNPLFEKACKIGFQIGKDIIRPIIEPGKSSGYNLDFSYQFLENYHSSLTAKSLTCAYPPWTGQKISKTDEKLRSNSCDSSGIKKTFNTTTGSLFNFFGLIKNCLTHYLQDPIELKTDVKLASCYDNTVEFYKNRS